jgi:phage-related protein
MPTVAAGVSELRVQGEDGMFRVFYYTVLKSNWPENA